MFVHCVSSHVLVGGLRCFCQKHVLFSCIHESALRQMRWRWDSPSLDPKAQEENEAPSMEPPTSFHGRKPNERKRMPEIRSHVCVASGYLRQQPSSSWMRWKWMKRPCRQIRVGFRGRSRAAFTGSMSGKSGRLPDLPDVFLYEFGEYLLSKAS